MPLFRVLRTFLSWMVMIYLVTVMGVAGYATLQPFWEPTDIKADLIVVLGGGMSPRGSLHTSSTVRVDKGTALFKAGVAPRIHFTGGLASPNAPSAGQVMAERAIKRGVPQSATSFEGKSYSTLQKRFVFPNLIGKTQITLSSSPKAFTYPAAGPHSKPLAAKTSPLSMPAAFAGIALWQA